MKPQTWMPSNSLSTISFKLYSYEILFEWYLQLIPLNQGVLLASLKKPNNDKSHWICKQYDVDQFNM